MTSDGYCVPVQQGAGALVELLATGPAAEPAIALGGALRSLRHGFRSAFQALHHPLREREWSAYKALLRLMPAGPEARVPQSGPWPRLLSTSVASGMPSRAALR